MHYIRPRAPHIAMKQVEFMQDQILYSFYLSGTNMFLAHLSVLIQIGVKGYSNILSLRSLIDLQIGVKGYSNILSLRSLIDHQQTTSQSLLEIIIARPIIFFPVITFPFSITFLIIFSKSFSALKQISPWLSTN